MKVFISWATDTGDVSKTVARALREWLPSVIQAVEPWVSVDDLTPGKRWNDQIQRELETTGVGIFCVTKESQLRQWMQFEAGAFAKSIKNDAYVIPYLIQITDGELQGPLQGFQAVSFNEEGTKALIETINTALAAYGGASLTSGVVERQFEKYWPDLRTTLDALPEQVVIEHQTPKGLEPTSPAPQEVLNELVRLSRDTNAILNKLESRENLSATSLYASTVKTDSSSYKPLRDLVRQMFGVEAGRKYIAEMRADLDVVTQFVDYVAAASPGEIRYSIQPQEDYPGQENHDNYRVVMTGDLPPASFVRSLIENKHDILGANLTIQG